MSVLLGADTRRVDLIAEGLRGHSQDIQDLGIMAQRAVAEMRSAWAGPDFESIARRWEQEAGPSLTDVSTALRTMATALRAQAEGQRQASDNTGSPGVQVGSGGTPGRVAPGVGVISGGGEKEIEDLDPDDLDVSPKTDVLGQPLLMDRVKDNVKLAFAQGGVDVDAAAVSLGGGDDSSQYELSAGKVEATADYSADLDAHGNLVASAGVSAAAYVGHAAGKVHGGSDLANGTMGAKAYAGGEAMAHASGLIGPQGAKGRLGAEAFAGAKVEVNVSGTVAGVTATAGAEISYGIGAHADVEAELSATKVGVLVDVGATLGIGAGVKFDASVSPQEVIANVGHVVEEMGDAAEDVGRGLNIAADQVGRFLDW